MPGYRAHLVCGAAVFVAIWSVYYLYASYALDTYAAVGCFSTLIGAILPDCDTRSAGRNMLNMVLVPACVLCMAWKLYVMCMYLVAFWGVTGTASHRGITHTLWFPVICLLLLGIYGYQHGLSPPLLVWACGCLLAGYLSHIILDRVV